MNRDGALARRYRIARRTVGGWFLPVLGPGLLDRLSRSWTVERSGEEHLQRAAASGAYLMAMWHGRMLVGLSPHRDRDYCVLVSPSDDGTLMTQMLTRNGYRIIRGSSNQRSEPALRDMLAHLDEAGGALVITPDGPRGPRHAMNAGLAWIARVSGYPIVPCGFVCDRAWRLSSWDRCTVPKPRARVVLAYGEPVRVENESDEAAATELVRERMIAAERAGFDRLGVEVDW